MTLTIGQLAERSGVATSAIRFYESRGLISLGADDGQPAPLRAVHAAPGRVHPTAQRVGLTLEEIGEALATLPDGRTPTKADWHRLSQTWRPRLDAQIRRIELLRDRLDGCIGCGCLSLRSCALTNPGDDLADLGPGAVLLDPDKRPW